MFSLAREVLYVADLDLWIDSNRPRQRCYVSHGHADHARPHDVVITSPTTPRICAQRFRAPKTFETHDFNEPWTLGEHRLTLSPRDTCSAARSS